MSATIAVTTVLPNGDAVCDEASIDAFQQRMAKVCGTLNALHAELVEMIAEALRTGAWKQWGIRSIEQYVTWQTGLSAGRARQLVRAARRRDELPETMTRFSRGELTLDQVSVVAAHAPADVDAQVAGFATVATVAQLQSTLSKYSWKQPTDTPVERDRDVASAGFDDAGRYHLRVNAPAEVGAIIDAALNEARDALFHDGHPDVTWLDAVREIAERSLDTVTTPSRRDRYRVYLHVDTTTPIGETEGPRAWFNAGPATPPWLRDLLCCDTAIQPLVHANAIPVSVGRRQYIVPPHTRRVITDRDRTCRHPGCTCRTYLDVHHIRAFLHGGTTDLDNLCLLCPKHHAAYHRGEFTITGNPNIPGDLRFYDTRGRPIKPVGTPTPPEQPPPLSTTYVHPSGERLDKRWVYFHQN